MTTAWKVTAATAVVGWLVSPVITYFLPKIISFLGFDPSQKLRQLEFCIIPDLMKTLTAIDQERMLERENKKKSEVAVLDKMAGMLRHAREDAEDIFDDAEEIELYRNRCWQRLYGAVKACIARWSDPTLHELADKLVGLHGALATCFMWLRRWAGKIIGLQRSEDVLPVTTSTVGPSDEPIPATAGAATSDSDEPPGPVTLPSESWGWCVSCLCSIFHFLEDWFGIAVRFACFLRDWSYQVIGITNNQVHTQFDCPLLISCKLAQIYGSEGVVNCIYISSSTLSIFACIETFF
jgi:hypothetical protein